MKKPFGPMPDGSQAFLYTITNDTLTAEISDCGATLIRLFVPDKNGNLADVVLGFDQPSDYIASGTFFGLRQENDVYDMACAVMEGVAFMLRKNCDHIRSKGTEISHIIATGGGSKSPIWCQLQADITGLPVVIPTEKEAACLGCAIIGAVSEGVFTEDGKKYGEVLAKKIDAETGIETKFARFAHVVRGGDPTLRDRLTASRMGVRAVELLLEGKSNLVVCEIDGKITDLDINYALIADRNYKNKLKPGDLEKFSTEQVAAMKALAAQRHEEMLDVYRMVAETSK